MSVAENIVKYQNELPEDVTLVAISKTKPNEAILEAYNEGQRIFGENKIQEMVDKYDALPKDIEWHMVGHVQTNKVKYMAPFVNLIHAVDSVKLLKEINKEANKNNRLIHCLLQIKIAEEDTKFGITIEDAENILNSEEYKKMKNVRIAGLMGMATFTEDEVQVSAEFSFLKKHFDFLKQKNKDFEILSMGMSGDFKIAIANGSNMVRLGSSIFGER